METPVEELAKTDETALIERLRSGEKKAFREFEARFRLPVRVKLRTSMPWQQADRLTQKVLKQAFKTIRDEPRIEQRLAHYVLSVCRNTH